MIDPVVLDLPIGGEIDWNVKNDANLTALANRVNSVVERVEYRVNAVNIREYGAAEGADSTGEIQDCLDAEDHVYFGPGTWQISSALVVRPGQHIVLARGAVIEQSGAWPTPVFDCLDADDAAIFGPGVCRYVGTRGGVGSSFRGGAGYLYAAAVWTNANGVLVDGLRSEDFAVAVALMAWDTGSSTNTTGHDRNRVRNLEISGADFGVFVLGQDNPEITDVTAWDFVDSSSGANPLHGVYVNGDLVACNNVLISRFRARGCPGHILAVKDTDGVVLESIDGDDCAGNITVQGCTDIVIDGVRSTNERVIPASAGVVDAQTTDNDRVTVRNIDITMLQEQRALSLWADNMVIDGVHIEGNWSSGSPGFDVVLRGDNGTMDNVRIRNRGSARTRCIALGTGGTAVTGWSVGANVITEKTTYVFTVEAGSTVKMANAEAAQVDFTAGYIDGYAAATVTMVDPTEDVQEFPVTGTWNKPWWAKLDPSCVVEGELISAGSGGGSGRRGAAGTVRCGGGAGGPGAVTRFRCKAGDLTDTVAVAVGTGGTGGAAVTADNTDGNPGTAGGTTTFGTYARAFQSGAGAGGTATAGTGGSTGVGNAGVGAAGAAASVTGGAGTSGTTTSTAGPGGAGGGITTGDVAGAGGAGGYTLVGNATPASGGVVGGASPGAGYDQPSTSGLPGNGGGGGAASTSGAAQAGAAGGRYGGGGGGGGASVNGNNSGAGGAGGAGFARIITRR